MRSILAYRHAGRELYPVFGVGTGQQLVPCPDRIVPVRGSVFNVDVTRGEVRALHAPWLNLVGLEVPEHTPVVVVPPHLD